MATRVHRPAESFAYVLKADRALPIEQQSRFVCRPMTQAERQALRDDVNRRVECPDGSRMVVSRTRQVAREVVLEHVVAIENFPAGEPLDWPVGKSREERAKYLEMLDDDAVFELGNHIFERSDVGAELKNF